MIIVGRRDTRDDWNAAVRKLKGFNDPLPMVDDRLICTKTLPEQNIFKGSIWYVYGFDGWVDSKKIREKLDKWEDEGGHDRDHR